MNPIRITKLDHVVLRVADIEKSVRFYRDVLGCPLANENLELGLYQFRAGASMIDLVPIDGPLGTRSGYGSPDLGRNVDHFALTVKTFDPDAIGRYLESCGYAAENLGRRFGADGKGYSLQVKDPDGNVVELKGPCDEPDPNAIVL